MPHFENLDQYETKNPKSGKQEIVPIAPHSLQATEYRPRKRESGPVQKGKRLGEFKKMEFEPVSVEQMEKEFKAAGRMRRRSKSNRSGNSIWKRLLKFFSSLLGVNKQSGKQRRKKHRGQKNKRSRNNGQQATQTEHSKKGGKKYRSRSGKNRPQKSGQQNQQNQQNQQKKRQQGDPRRQKNQQQSGNPPAQKDHGQSGEAGQNKPRNKRNRRNRGRGNRPGSHGNQQSGNQ